MEAISKQLGIELEEDLHIYNSEGNLCYFESVLDERHVVYSDYDNGSHETEEHSDGTRVHRDNDELGREVYIEAATEDRYTYTITQWASDDICDASRTECTDSDSGAWEEITYDCNGRVVNRESSEDVELYDEELDEACYQEITITIKV